MVIRQPTRINLVLQVSAGRPVDEVAVDEYLTGRRRAQPGFVEPSFPTIAGSGANGAIIHYRAQPGSCAPVTAQQLLLVDSGARTLETLQTLKVF